MSEDLKRLTADLTKAGTKANAAAAVVVAASAAKVAAEARRNAPRTRLQHYAKSITWQMLPGRMGSAAAEVGAEKGGQGSLSHLFEFGSANTAPKPHIYPAADAEESAFLKALGEAADPFR